AHGFDVVGIARPDAIPQAQERLLRFLAEGAHGDMAWMATTAERRGDPRALWPEARSVIMLGMNYGPDHDPLAILRERSYGAISVQPPRFRSPIASMRGAAFPISRSSTKARSHENCARAWAIASMAAMTAWRSARGTSSHSSGARRNFLRASGSRRRCWRTLR